MQYCLNLDLVTSLPSLNLLGERDAGHLLLARPCQHEQVNITEPANDLERCLARTINVHACTAAAEKGVDI
jgi:hypothetical protein